jgi:hypothetical protein
VKNRLQMGIIFDISIAWLDCGEAASSGICSGISSFGSGIAGEIQLHGVCARFPFSKEHRR